ncbi:MAG: hypothetical protein JXB50_11085 [Spirochaetes bacterium]|nr:hypothetical protein [Spirochaetota bacterium]
MRNVFITGHSVISSLGVDVEESINSLETNKDTKYIPDKSNIFHKPYFPVNFNFDDKSDMTLCAKIALKLLSLTEDQWLKLSPLPVFMATSTGGIKETEIVYTKNFNKGIKFDLAGRHYFYDVIPEIKKRYDDKLTGFMTFSTACSSAGHSLMHAFNFIKNGIINKALILAFDALSITTLYGFDSLKLVSENGTMPLTVERDGLSLGEGGAIMILESDPSVDPIAEVKGVFSNSDGYHITSPHPDGKMQIECIKKTLNIAGIYLEDIDYINAHGTGTQTNDEIEMNVIKSIFNHKPSVSSLKGFIGHTVGSSALIELVLCIEMLKKGRIYQPLNIKTVLDEELIPEKTINKTAKYFLKNSFGFGGNNVSIVVKNLF